MVNENNKKIAKNTLLLYVRMLFSMGVSLYTSRVVLQVLGVENFGIYNVVGGIITMISFINGGMVSSTQRYITFELGKGDVHQLHKVFITSVQIHLLISVVILILAETIGLWFLLNKLVIPEDRLVSAIWVYECSIIACIVSIMSIPYNAAIIAHEKMSAFAYISIVDVVLKLLIVYLLLIIPFDKLIVYAILMLSVQIIIRFIFTNYCQKHFLESKYEHHVDLPLLKEMASFAGWSFWGNLAGVLYTQGLNMMLNVYFGPLVNAARGIAVQVQTATQGFVTNFQMALNPQITKKFANQDLRNMHSLMFRSARFSFFLLFFLTLPVLLETKFILEIWLKTVPDDTVTFIRIMILISLIYTTANPCIVANQATGKVKKYQMVVGGTLLTILPISYLILELDAPAYSVFIVHFFVESIAQILRLYMLRNLINLSFLRYLRNVYVPIVSTVLLACIFPTYVHFSIAEGLFRFIFVGFSCVFSTIVFVFMLGLTKNERTTIISNFITRLKK